MTQIVSAIDPNSAAFEENAATMSALVEELKARTAEAALGGSERSRERHVSLSLIHISEPTRPY